MLDELLAKGGSFVQLRFDEPWDVRAGKKEDNNMQCKRIRKICNFIVYTWFAFSFIVLLVTVTIVLIGNSLIKDLNSEKAIKEYNALYLLVTDLDFIEGKIIEKGVVILTMNDKTTKEISFQSDTKYIYGLYRGENNEVILQSSGGIFAADNEIVFNDYMIFDQNRYISITHLDDNLFLCELRH